MYKKLMDIIFGTFLCEAVKSDGEKAVVAKKF